MVLPGLCGGVGIACCLAVLDLVSIRFTWCVVRFLSQCVVWSQSVVCMCALFCQVFILIGSHNQPGRLFSAARKSVFNQLKIASNCHTASLP